MSILIKGMEMPESCFDCPISHFAYCRAIGCGITGKTISAPDCEEKRIDDCPLIPVPKQHGNLIDKLALCHELKDKWKADSLNAFSLMNDIYICFARIVLAAPVIIPEEEGE